MALNLERQLLFYGAYHHDPVNIFIHMTCVPAILITAFALAGTSGPVVPIPPSFQVPYLPPDLGTIAAFLYSTLYILMEPVAGGLLAPLIIGGTAYSHHLIGEYGQLALNWAIGIHIFSWIAQFIGHGKFEGRAPALLDNLVQALFLAPLFVWLEFLFLLGYRPELQARLKVGVEKELAKFRAEKAAKANGKANGSANGKAKH